MKKTWSFLCNETQCAPTLVKKKKLKPITIEWKVLFANGNHYDVAFFVYFFLCTLERFAVWK